jgi:hypothetical protein
MSASICWEPVKTNPKTLSVPAPSRFIATLDALGVGMPGEVGEEHEAALRALSIHYGDTERQNPFEQLLRAIEKHGRVRVWAEY